ncbi:MAG: LysE family transporter [Candidatus Methanomethylicaceae archaeon]
MPVSWGEFLIMVVAVSASGVMSPGPLTFAAMASGSKRGWRAGPSVGLGHTIVELPLVFVIAMGATFIVGADLRWITLAGGVFMVTFGVLTIRGTRKEQKGVISRLSEHPLTVGLGLSSLNPYFIIWWVTLGAPLVIIATDMAGIFGVAVMYASHVWLDFVWLTVLAGFGSKGKRLGKWYHFFVVALGLIVLTFGIVFIVRAICGVL